MIEKNKPEKRVETVYRPDSALREPMVLFANTARDLARSRFLRTLGLRFQAVEPRMSRDFLVTFGNAADAREAAAVLASGRDRDGTPLFEVDNRGTSLFVMLTYPDAIESSFTARFERRVVDNFAVHVVFVAIKNSHHNGAGYFLDSGAPAPMDASEMPLTDLWQRVQSAF